MLAGFAPFPADPMHHRRIESDGSLPRTGVHAAAAIVTFARIHDHWRLSLNWVWEKQVHLADIDTDIAAVADLGIERQRIGGRRLRYGHGFGDGHSIFLL
jgi:hypothetical protein